MADPKTTKQPIPPGFVTAELFNATRAVEDDLRTQKDTLLIENKRLRAAILWALGEGDSDFGDHKPANPGPFWWRSELKERAGL